MSASPHRFSTSTGTQGFSLVELSVVIAILAVVATFGLEAAATFINRNAGVVSKERLAIADNAIAKFFKIYGRLPCPASISAAPTSNAYGAEDCTIAEWGTDADYTVKIGGGIMYGGLPFRALNLPITAALDGFNSKLNYAVTKNLTAAGGTVSATPVINRFGSFDTDNTCTSAPTCAAANAASNTAGMGGIEIRSGILEQPCGGTQCQILANPTYSFSSPSNLTSTGAAYIIFSNGADKRGAYSLRGDIQNASSTASSCMPSASAYAMRVDTQNCQYGADSNTTSVPTIPKNVFYDNRINSGYNLTSYFDDYVVWRTKGAL